MRQETFTLSQKELRRMTVIAQCVQGNLTCARAAEMLALSHRHIKRLKSRYRQGSAAALAHVSRGRPSHRRTPQNTRSRILALARTRYAGFNRSGIFTRNDEHWSIDEQLAGLRHPTQFGRALDQLGVTFIAAQSPQAKGRSERLWGVLQGSPHQRTPPGWRLRPRRMSGPFRNYF